MKNISYITTKKTMKHYVYILFNEAGTVEYVGRTVNPKTRMTCHKCKPHMNKSGTSLKAGGFHGRDDISMEIVKELGTEDEAKAFEGQLKLEFGFEWTEQTRASKGGKKGGKTGVGARKNKEVSSQPVLAYRKDTGAFVGEFPSQTEAARQLGLNVGGISMVLAGGKQKSIGGYTFKRTSPPC
jgi:predicted GIY-YIG superfamily endonuclease